MKLLSGVQTRFSSGDVSLSGGLGVKAYPWPWLSASAYLPYNWNQGRDDQTGRTVDLHGIGDLSVALAFDLLELIRPTMIRTRCPQTGGPLLALRDDDDVIKSPHLVLTAGTSFPTGKDDHRRKWWAYPPQYQPGAGAWSASAGIFYSQGFRAITVGAGLTYAYGGEANTIGYDRPDTLAASASLGWLFWYQRLGKLFVATKVLIPLSEGKIEGRSLRGSDLVMVLVDVGASFWVGSFWRQTRKIHAGVMATLPAREGASSSQPMHGYALSVFTTFGF
jgi:hypothetical protein